jgi:FKBP-type peptidyl-prolyl cis-trans isomerase 2
MLQKKDFIEIEFTARVKNGEVFDSNIKEDLEKLHEGHSHPIESEPFVFSLGEGMFLNAIDDFLIGKPETPATYEIELSPEQAFGKRNARLIQKIPMKIFREQKINPIPGFSFNFDGRIGRVLASSGGRVIVDFNNPISGKEVVYKIKILKKISDLHEKAKALIKFLFRENLKFEIKEKKLIIEVEKPLVEFVSLFKDKFKEILDLELEIREVEKKSEKPAEIEGK